MDATIWIVADEGIDAAVLAGSGAVAADIARKTIGTADQNVRTKRRFNYDGNSMLLFLHVFRIMMKMEEQNLLKKMLLLEIDERTPLSETIG